jgi:hypothetical protein
VAGGLDDEDTLGRKKSSVRRSAVSLAAICRDLPDLTGGGNLNGIQPSDRKFHKNSLSAIKMPNRDVFVPDPEFREISNLK